MYLEPTLYNKYRGLGAAYMEPYGLPWIVRESASLWWEAKYEEFDDIAPVGETPWADIRSVISDDGYDIVRESESFIRWVETGVCNKSRTLAPHCGPWRHGGSAFTGWWIAIRPYIDGPGAIRSSVRLGDLCLDAVQRRVATPAGRGRSVSRAEGAVEAWVMAKVSSYWDGTFILPDVSMRKLQGNTCRADVVCEPKTWAVVHVKRSVQENHRSQPARPPSAGGHSRGLAANAPANGINVKCGRNMSGTSDQRLASSRQRS